MFQTNEHMIVSLIFLLILAGLTAYYASRKGRNPWIWFTLGILIGIFAPLILLFLSLKEQSEESADDRKRKESSPLSSAPDLKPSASQPRQEEEDKLWYYLDRNHQQMGPVSMIALKGLWNTGRLDLSTYVWTNGMSQWERVDHLEGLKQGLNKP